MSKLTPRARAMSCSQSTISFGAKITGRRMKTA
jgi:hypothetical protein